MSATEERLTLARWQSYLRERMDELDQTWKALDQIWERAPKDSTAEITEQADKFYQSYWDVFHAAVECDTFDALSAMVPEAIAEASGHVAEAWKRIAEDEIGRLDDAVEDVRRAGLASALAGVREQIDRARKCREYTGALIEEERHSQAIECAKACLEHCRTAAHKLDDAVAAGKEARKSVGLNQVAAIAGALVAGAALMSLFFAYCAANVAIQ